MSDLPASSNKIIKRSKSKDKEKELIDDLLAQLEADQSSQVEESGPIEITEQVKERMVQLMDSFLNNRAKLAKVSAIRKELTSHSSTYLKDLQTLMKLYGLTELIKGEHKFTLDQTVKKVPLKKDEFKEVVAYVLNDPDKLDKIYETAEQSKQEVMVEKLKCLKYKGK
jgi:hypothetical protein